MKELYLTILAGSGILTVLAGFFILTCREKMVPKLEALARERMMGVIMGTLALCWCVPHVQPIIFDWMLPWLWPLVAVLAMLCYFFLDYLFTRALGGVLIIGSYYLVHKTFDYHIPISVAVTLAAWGLGIVGIVISGKPCLLRDWFRASAKSKYWRVNSALLLWIAGGIFITAFLMELMR